MGLVTISAYSSRELLAIIAALKAAPADWRRAIRSETRSVALKEWTTALERRAASVPEVSTALVSATLVRTARVKVSDQNVTLTAASVGRKLKGGLLPSEKWAGIEFGANREAFTEYRATRGGRAFSVKRRTKRQLPPRARGGHVAYPAASEVIPRIAALWAQTVARSIHEALEGGRHG